MATATPANPAARKNIPGTPSQRSTTGPSISAAMNIAPMQMPITAMALVRCSEPGEIRGQRQYRRGDGACALEGAAGHDPEHAVGESGDQASHGEYHQAESNNGLASVPVRPQTERDLKNCLGESVDSKGEPDQKRGGAVQSARVQREHRQHHKQAEHTQREDSGERARPRATRWLTSYSFCSIRYFRDPACKTDYDNMPHCRARLLGALRSRSDRSGAAACRRRLP